MRLLPDTILEKLIKGNERFVSGQLEHPNRCAESKKSATSFQEPQAIILGCSDSRVPVEILFDLGIGDIFVVRVAGNVLGILERESISFAVRNFHSPLIVVLGHENCGAVTAIREGKIEELQETAKCISSTVKIAPTLEIAVKENVLHVVKTLREIPFLAHLIEKNELDIVGGFYQLLTGQVVFFK